MLAILNFTSEDYPENIYTLAFEISNDTNVKEAMAKAAAMYVGTPEGKKVYERNGCKFDCNDFVQSIPEGILKKCGLTPMFDFEQYDIDYREVLVQEDEEDDE